MAWIERSVFLHADAAGNDEMKPLLKLLISLGALASVSMATVHAQPCEEGDWRCEVFEPKGRGR